MFKMILYIPLKCKYTLVDGVNEQSCLFQEKLENLPEAHTCFNQLVLPDYRNKEVLKRKLTIAISNAEGFGLE